MSEPLISVIMPVYNVQDKLDRGISSVAGQTYNNLEIILVDDGSADDSGRICDEWARRDGRIIVIHKKNAGLAAARRSGIDRASGRYIGFVDSDDWVHPQMYEYLLKLINENDADVSSAGIIKTEKETYDRADVQEKVVVYSRDEFAKRFFKIGSQEIVHYVWNKLYKKEVAENAYVNNNFSVGEDVLATYRMLLKADKIVESNVPMYFYRMSSGMTSTFGEKYFRLKDVWTEVSRLANERGGSDASYAQINLARINFTILSEMAIAGEYNNHEYIKKREELKADLKKNKKLLLDADIAASRKLMINWFCINYESAAFFMSKFMKRRQ